MPKFSSKSKYELNTCEYPLQLVLNEAIKYIDFTIIQGYRSKKEQNEAYRKGYSRVMYPNSKHNNTPSLAVDVAPYPINWSDTNRFYYFAGYIMSIAIQKGIKLRWGGDWDRDTQVVDQTFMDLGHFELL